MNVKSGYGGGITSIEEEKVLDVIGEKCVWCRTYGYNKHVDKGSCHVWVNGQCKRPGDVVGIHIVHQYPAK